MTTLETIATCERRFAAMGSTVHVYVVGGGHELLDLAERTIEGLESSWSRFRPDSELSRLNDEGEGHVSEELFDAISRAVHAWYATDGAFDPTILRTLEAAGYDRTFADVRDDASDFVPVPSPGCAGITLDAIDRTVELPSGVAIDLGGIGKGLAADIVSRELIEAGATGALVNVGGDVRVRGEAASDAGWIVSIADPFARRDLSVALADGAIATSTTLKRHWVRANKRMHHLIDPRTGAPVESDLVSVSVIAQDAWWAEVLTKVVFLTGSRDGADFLDAMGLHGLLFTRDRESIVAGDWRDLLP